MNDKGRQMKAQKKKLNVSSDCPSHQGKGEQVPILCDELVVKLEEVDKLIRE